MLSTKSGKAIRFVEKLHAELAKFNRVSHSELESLGADDLVLLVEQLLYTQDRFIQEGKPHFVDVGYHYTQAPNIDRIRTDGLLTKGERYDRGIDAVAIGGAFFGDGVYTADNPTAFQKRGNVGLFVARLKGREVRHLDSVSYDRHYDTLIGKKNWTPSPHFSDEIVLRSSTQVLPLIKYPTTMLTHDIDD